MSVFLIVLGIYDVTQFNVTETAYFEYLLHFVLLIAGVGYLREYNVIKNRKYPDLQIEEDGYFIWTNFRQNKKIHFWWDSMDSLGKENFKKNVGIEYTINYTIEHQTGLYDGNERKFVFKNFENQMEIASAIVYSYNQYKKREIQDSRAISTGGLYKPLK